jgi:hypothetical protein
VPIDELLDTLLIANLANKVIQTDILWRVAWLNTAVSLGAGVWRGTAWIGVPIRFPVAVDVPSKTRLVWRIGRGRLPVLPPQTVVGLVVDEAW